MKLVLRTKVLIGMAVLIGGYVVFFPTESAPAESSKDADRGGSGARAHALPAAPTHVASATQALYRFAHRVADGTSARALFAPHSWYVAPPPPPPPPPAPAASLVPPKPTAPPLPFQFMGS